MIHGTSKTADQQCVLNVAQLAQKELASPPATAATASPKSLRPKKKIQSPPASVRWAPPTIPAADSRQKTVASRSPTPTDSFQAQDDDDAAIPPDVGGAVGPNHVVSVHNTNVRIQDRIGNILSTVSLNGFWSSLNVPDVPDVFDPKILYDPGAGRWIFTAFANPELPTSSVMMGVSQTSDPTGNWNLFRIDADTNDEVFVDYPSLGFNKDWIVVTANVFDNFFGDFIGVDLYVFDKASLFANTGKFTLLHEDSGFGFTLVPAITYDASVSTLYLLEDFDNFNGQLRLSTITGAVGSEILTLNVGFPTSPEIWSFVGNEAAQLGSAKTIDSGDSRIQNVVLRNGSLWCTHAIYPVDGDTLLPATVQWWQISTAGAVTQRGRIGDPSGATSFSYPTIAVNSTDDCLIGYSRFSAAQFASANYAFRFGTDPKNTFRADVVLKAGEAPYFKDHGGDLNRWGDFSSTVVDPVNDREFWTIQQYAATPVAGIDRWGTWWGHIVPADTGDFVTVTTTDKVASEPGTNTASFTVRRAGTQGDLSVNYAMSGTAVNGTDYQQLSGTVVIPDGSASAKVIITAIDNDKLDGTRSVILTLTAGTGYGVGNPSSARASIEDNELLTFSSAPTATPNPAITGTTVVFSAAIDSPDIVGVVWDFADGTQDTSNRLTVPHGFQSAGDYEVSVLATHKSGAVALATVVVTISDDTDGDGIPDVSDPDIDGDGFPNDLESAFGSDPFDPDSTPNDGAQGGPARPIQVSRFQAKLNLVQFFRDTIQFSGSIPIDAETAPLTRTFIVSIGGIIAKMPLDGHGRGSDGLNTAKLMIRQKKGSVPAQSAKFTIKFTKGDFVPDLADEGVTIDKPVKDKPVTIDIFMLFEKTVYKASVNTLYTADPTRSGSLKLVTKKPVPKK